ncbi:MAG: hypothetical protein AAF617_09400 [Bacteroidota bacterium]
MKSGRKIQFKHRLSIAKIGKIRFWTGIVLGSISALILYSFIFFFFEIVNMMRVGMSSDIPFQSDKALHFEHIILLAISIALGNHTMIRYWFLQPTFHFYKTRKKVTLHIANYSLFIEFLCWYMIVAFLRDWAAGYFLVGFGAYNVYEYLLFTIPAYLFLTAWTEVARFFKVGTWKLYTFVISLFCVISLSFVDLSSYRYATFAYEKMYEEELYYIENEFNIAKEKYGIHYTAETITQLKQLKTDDLKQLLLQKKQKIESTEQVALKDIILQKILIHNFKSAHFEGYGEQYYPDPIDIYAQLKKVAPASNEAFELLNILDEFHQLTFFMSAYMNTKGKSPTFRQKTRILSDANDLYYYKFYKQYVTMREQINVLMHAFHKQEKYHHPFIKQLKDTELPPQIPLTDASIYQKFPELKD